MKNSFALHSLGLALLSVVVGACAADIDAQDEVVAQEQDALTLQPIKPVLVDVFSVNCDPGPVRRIAADGTVEVSGTWGSTHPLSWLRVDGHGTSLESDGTWSVRRPAKPGMNVYKVEARNTLGAKSSQLCSVNAAERTITGQQLLADGIVLGLRSTAFDDGAPANTVESLGDVARRVLQHQKMHDTIHEALDDMHKLFTKGDRTLYYKSISYDTPEIDLYPSANSLRVSLTLPNVRLKGNLHYDGLIDTDRSTTLKVEYMRIHAQINLSANAGTVAASVELYDDTEVGKISADVGGWLFDGFIDEIIENKIEDSQKSFKKKIAEKVESYIDEDLADIFADMVRDINEGGLSNTTTLNVPNLTKPGSTKLVLTSQLSDLALSGVRTSLFNVSTKVSGTKPMTASDLIPVHQSGALPEFFEENLLATCGNVPMPNPFSSQWTDWMACRAKFERPSAGAVSYGLLNQALRQLWKDGYFEVTDVLTKFGIPAGSGASLSLFFESAPVVQVAENQAELKAYIGPVRADMSFPGLNFSAKGNFFAEFSVPFKVVDGKTINLDQPTVESVRFDPFGSDGAAEVLIPMAVNQATHKALQSIMNKTLDGIKVMDVPSFETPKSAQSWGLPAGQVLSLHGATVSGSASHLMLKGTFVK